MKPDSNLLGGCKMKKWYEYLKNDSEYKLLQMQCICIINGEMNRMKHKFDAPPGIDNLIYLSDELLAEKSWKFKDWGLSEWNRYNHADMIMALCVHEGNENGQIEFSESVIESWSKENIIYRIAMIIIDEFIADALFKFSDYLGANTDVKGNFNSWHDFEMFTQMCLNYWFDLVYPIQNSIAENKS